MKLFENLQISFEYEMQKMSQSSNKIKILE